MHRYDDLSIPPVTQDPFHRPPGRPDPGGKLVLAQWNLVPLVVNPLTSARRHFQECSSESLVGILACGLREPLLRVSQTNLQIAGDQLPNFRVVPHQLTEVLTANKPRGDRTEGASLAASRRGCSSPTKGLLVDSIQNLTLADQVTCRADVQKCLCPCGRARCQGHCTTQDQHDEATHVALAVKHLPLAVPAICGELHEALQRRLRESFIKRAITHDLNSGHDQRSRRDRIMPAIAVRTAASAVSTAATITGS